MLSPRTEFDIGRDLAYALDAALWATDALGISLHPWQADVLCAHGAQLLLCTRQGGKSRTVSLRALHELLFREDARSLRPRRQKTSRKSCFDD